MKEKVDCHNCIYYRMCEFVHEFYETECNDFKSKADFVEVVRCKDCVKAIKFDKFGNYRCKLFKRFTAGIHYCSCGERKDVTDINVGDK